MFPESRETKFWSQSLHLQNWGILQNRMVILVILKQKNEYHRQLELKKEMKEMESFI